MLSLSRLLSTSTKGLQVQPNNSHLLSTSTKGLQVLTGYGPCGLDLEYYPPQ